MANINSPALQEFYKNTPMREGILNWYPFAFDACVLESSGGALTDLLRRRCGKVAQMQTDIDGLPFNPAEGGIKPISTQLAAPQMSYSGTETFDYVVVLDPDDLSRELLANFHAFLRPRGKLLLAYENPFGMQNFAGKRDHKTGMPHTFNSEKSKAAVCKKLQLAGFAGQKWYYPFPNHYFTREIYSDNYLPNEFLNHRGSAYIENDYTKMFDERSLWQEVIRGGAFTFLCGAYLVEASVCATGDECDVDFAAITAYRQPEKAFITTVHSNGTAKKRAVFKQGKAQLEQIAKRHEELNALGVSILPVAVEGDTLEMKRVNLPTLWDYWTKKLIEGTLQEDELIAHYDKLYSEISKTTGTGKAYWELVPANCFYNEETGEIMFFDQEYAWEDVDPNIVMVRAILALTFAAEFREDARTAGWINTLKYRYGLCEKWGALAPVASRQAHEFVFNTQSTVPLESASEHALWQIAENELENRKKLRRYQLVCKAVQTLQNKGYSCPAIYGYGERGKMLRGALHAYGYSAACVVDKCGVYAAGVPVYAAVQDIAPDVKPDIIVVTPNKDAEVIADEIRANTKVQVVTLGALT